MHCLIIGEFEPVGNLINSKRLKNVTGQVEGHFCGRLFRLRVGGSYSDDGPDDPVSVVMSSVISYDSIRIFDVWTQGRMFP